MGRRSKLNDKLIEKACEYIRAGNYAKMVCQYLDISEVTYYDWIKKAEAQEVAKRSSIYTKFLKSIKRAEAEAEIRNVTIIQNEAKKTWQAAAWYLERKHKDRWGQQSKVHLSGSVENTGKQTLEIVDLSAMTKEELDETLRKMVARIENIGMQTSEIEVKNGDIYDEFDEQWQCNDNQSTEPDSEPGEE